MKNRDFDQLTPVDALPDTEVVDDENHLTKNYESKRLKQFVFLLGLSMSLLHIYLLGFALVKPLILFAIHWCFGMVMAFLYYPSSKKANRKKVTWVEVLLILGALAVTIYVLSGFDQLMQRSVTGNTNLPDMMAGIMAILITLEAGRRTIGLALPIISVTLILYALFGGELPAMIACKGFTLNRLVGYLFSTEGIFSAPLKASAQQVFLLVLFGAFLTISGAGDFVMRLAMALAGAKRGGPAKVAVISSALFGSISGSAVANVIGTGNFTIPLMKKTGYQGTFAGAVEAVASTGGQIMPPVMGAGAFIMAELVGIPYSKVALAALFPALLYFYSLFLSIDLEAAKNNLSGVDKDKLERVWVVLKEDWLSLFPLAVLILTLAVMRMSVSKAAIISILACILGSWTKKANRMGVKKVLVALELGAKQSINIITAVSCAGIAIGCVMLTGLGFKFTFVISQLAGNSLLLSLLFSALAAIILGMGLPTVAAYIVSASVLASALISLGLLPISAHMFLFYYSILAMITPPVALAAYAGASIAKANFTQVGIQAMRLGLIAFILPFFFIYSPELLMVGSGGSILIALCTSAVGTAAFTIALYGWLWKYPIHLYQRILFLVSGLLLIKSGLYTDILGLILIALAVIFDKDVKAALKRRIFRQKLQQKQEEK